MALEVCEAFENAGASESILVCVEFQDINHSQVMEAFAERYPKEYSVYVDAKEKNIREETSDTQDEMLQRAVECKREVYREFYSKSNREILYGYYGDNKQIFVSSYAPMAIIKTNEKEAVRFARQDRVIAFSEYIEKESVTDAVFEGGAESSEWISDDFIEDLVIANQINRSDILKTKYNLTGSGIKIGIIEAEGLPDVTNEYLSAADITLDPYYTTDTSLFSAERHATQVAAILVASNDEGTYGVVPDAKLYCTIGDTKYDYYFSIEWLIECGVRIINASMGFQATAGYYDDCSAWTDHIAAVHDVHFVNAAGNYNEENEGYVISPGMAYNAITVGGFKANSADKADFSMYGDTCRRERGSAPRETYTSGQGRFWKLYWYELCCTTSSRHYCTTRMLGWKFVI